MPATPLTADQLYRRCDPDAFDFETTADLPDLTVMVGQDRAVEAVQFGVAMRRRGFNVFVLGPPGTGRHSFVRRYLVQRVSEQPTPPDRCYVNNFDEPRRPIALALPAGRGREFREDMARLVEEAYTTIPAAFESDEYRSRRQAIEEEFGKGQARRVQEITERARAKGIAIVQTPAGIAFAPIHDDKPLSPEEIEALSPDERRLLADRTQEVTDEVQAAMKAMPRLAREAREKVKALDREISLLAAGNLIDDLVEKYADVLGVVAYLVRVQSDLIDNVSLFVGGGETSAESVVSAHAGTSAGQPSKDLPAKRRYAVNLIVDHAGTTGAPLVFEENPTYQNLVGEVEYLAQQGALVTDFGLIRSGALHRANGGYLVLDAHKVLSQPFAWPALKQALEAQEIRIEPIGQAYSVVRTATLEPEPIPLDLKVILIGERWIYYWLLAADPDFAEFFRVAADFDDRMDRTPANDRLFAQLLGTLARQEGLQPVDRGGLARLIEESSRHAEHSGKLSAQVRRAADIMLEASHWAAQRGASVVGAEDVQHAIDRRIYRESRLRARLQEDILEDTILIDTEGERVGQVNGLAVIEVGEFAFAKPNRITARVSIGSGTVIDIERETKLGGPLHSKGILILSGFLAAQYVTDQPLSLQASIVLEQSYGGIEGDSASSGELYALLSALAGVPVRQCFAVTGSVNQHGEIQAIGGVNQKIEGFFDVASARGLDGTQGVLIPSSNVKHLMLRRDVIEAVRDGRFHIYPVRTVDEGLAILTGLPAGERDADGHYPEGSLNHRISARLIEFAERRRAFGGRGESDQRCVSQEDAP